MPTTLPRAFSNLIDPSTPSIASSSLVGQAAMQPWSNTARCTRLTTGAHRDMPCTLVLSPLIPPGASLPYYHPTVRHLAFRFVPCTPPILCIEAVVLPGTPSDPNSRLYRTALALLETLHRYGWGAMTHYQKRVKHDCVIPREAYQDLYLVMRERYKHLVSEWKESTDPLKHVFEVNGTGAT
ncbi:hypothetical protein J3R83DRAFT_10777 [Lanmaoa asiatica]|nr:hypothetical protein J3R83DRAFT_10777 [Lanmaoa asiatica]